MGTSSSYTAPTSGGWPIVKRQATQFAKQGGKGSVKVESVVSSYLVALGGASAAARRATAAREAAQRLGAFLGNVVDQGFDAALEQIGLANLVGQNSLTVLDALVNLLSSSGAALEEADARAAMLRTLQDIFDQPDGFDNLDEVGVGRIVENFLVEYIYERMLQEIGDRIENGAMTVEGAKSAEEDIRVYVVATVQLELARQQSLTVWESSEGRRIINSLLEDAYGQLE